MHDSLLCIGLMLPFELKRKKNDMTFSPFAINLFTVRFLPFLQALHSDSDSNRIIRVNTQTKKTYDYFQFDFVNRENLFYRN